MSDLYTNIKNRRKDLGLTQADLAKQVGYSNKTAIAHIERGDIDLPLSKIEKIAKALKTSPSDLMGEALIADENGLHTAKDLLQDEEQMIEKYRALPDYGKFMVQNFVDSAYKEAKRMEDGNNDSDSQGKTNFYVSR